MAISSPVYPITSIHDIKEVSKRTMQLGLLAVFLAFTIAVYYFFQHIYISSIIVGTFGIVLGFVLILNNLGYVKYTKDAIICSTNILLVSTVYAEGQRGHGYMFFLPLLFSIPFIVENNKSFNKELLFYFVITILSFSFCILFVDEQSTVQHITEAQYRKMFYVNKFSTVFLSAGFAFTAVVFERKYAKVILEEKNRVEEAMYSRSKFLSYMGHELRTPLNGIIGTINILKKEEMLPEQQQYFEILKYCSDHLLHQVNDILDFSKIEAGKLELNPIAFNLKQLVLNSALPFYSRFAEKKLDLQVDLSNCPDVTLLGDDVRLVQILNNLISNAFKFTQAGSVTVRAICRIINKEQIQVTFSVTDTGIGIDEINQKKIFENFSQVYHESTRQYGGSGLGISITERLLNLMDSRLELRSQLGKGSEFSFSVNFPLIEEPGQRNQEKVVSIEYLSGKKVLIAEDNLFNLVIAEKMLQDWDASYVAVTDGYEVLKALEKDGAYDIILLDLQMPNMDGYTAMQTITKLYPQIPVLAFTASLVDHKMLQELLAKGFSDCVLKPFHPDELLVKMVKYIK